MPLDTNHRTERLRSTVFGLTCLVLAGIALSFRPGVVLGESMAPAFHSGQVFLTSRVHDPGSLAPGDVVLTAVGGQLLLKRIHAVSGQSVWVLRTTGPDGIEDQLIAPGDLRRVRRAAGSYRGLGEVCELTVPEGCIYLVGDSLHDSFDSRHFGPVAADGVRSRVVVAYLFRLWGEGPAGGRYALAREP